MTQEQKQALNELKYIQKRFKNIPQSKIQQSKGRHSECGCCVGAWICHLLDLRNNTKFTNVCHEQDYILGLKHFYDLMFKLNIFAHLIDDLMDELLFYCGATYTPFGIAEWKEHPATVFKTLIINLENMINLGG